MHKFCKLLSCALLCFTLNGCQPSSDVSADASNSEQSQTERVIVPSSLPEGFSMKLPAGFSATQSPYYEEYYVCNDASIIVTGEQTIMDGVRLDEYTAQMRTSYEQTADDYALLETSVMDVNGVPCEWMEFRYAIVGEDARQEMHCLTAVLLQGRQVYILTCKSRAENFSSYEAAFRAAIESVTLTQKTAETSSTTEHLSN